MTKEKLKKGERTRLAIEDAAIELLMEQGYHATSMRQIAERSKLALGGIYNHFKSKDEIFEAIIVDKHPYKKVLPLILAAEGETMEEFLGNAARVIINELTSQQYYVKLMLIEIAEFNGAHGAALIKEIAPKILPVFERLVKSRKELPDSRIV
jgi:AcrR family transcriptional regulator